MTLDIKTTLFKNNRLKFNVKNQRSIYIIVAISLFVGSLHFLIGPNHNGIFKHFINGYLIDILLPLNIYLLMQIALRKKMKTKWCRAVGILLTFLFGLTIEILQYYDILVFGSTYDPLDILMYGIGVILGLFIDLLIIDKLERPLSRNE